MYLVIIWQDGSDPEDDDDTCEEWERHEALHNDVQPNRAMGHQVNNTLQWHRLHQVITFYLTEPRATRTMSHQIATCQQVNNK